MNRVAAVARILATGRTVKPLNVAGAEGPYIGDDVVYLPLDPCDEVLDDTVDHCEGVPPSASVAKEKHAKALAPTATKAQERTDAECAVPPAVSPIPNIADLKVTWGTVWRAQQEAADIIGAARGVTGATILVRMLRRKKQEQI